MTFGLSPPVAVMSPLSVAVVEVTEDAGERVRVGEETGLYK